MYNLNESNPTGKSARARAGSSGRAPIPQRVTAAQAAEIRRAARLPQQPISEPKERQKKKRCKITSFYRSFFGF